MAEQTCQGLIFKTLAGKVSVPSSLKWHGAGPLQPPKAPSVPGVLKCIISQCQILLYYFHFYLILHSGDIEDFKVYIAYKLH